MFEYHELLQDFEVPDAYQPLFMEEFSALLHHHNCVIPDDVYHGLMLVLQCRGDSACLSMEMLQDFSDGTSEETDMIEGMEDSYHAAEDDKELSLGFGARRGGPQREFCEAEISEELEPFFELQAEEMEALRVPAQPSEHISCAVDLGRRGGLQREFGEAGAQDASTAMQLDAAKEEPGMALDEVLFSAGRRKRGGPQCEFCEAAVKAEILAELEPVFAMQAGDEMDSSTVHAPPLEEIDTVMGVEDSLLAEELSLAGGVKRGGPQREFCGAVATVYGTLLEVIGQYLVDPDNRFVAAQKVADYVSALPPEEYDLAKVEEEPGEILANGLFSGEGSKRGGPQREFCEADVKAVIPEELEQVFELLAGEMDFLRVPAPPPEHTGCAGAKHGRRGGRGPGCSRGGAAGYGLGGGRTDLGRGAFQRRGKRPRWPAARVLCGGSQGRYRGGTRAFL